MKPRKSKHGTLKCLQMLGIFAAFGLNCSIVTTVAPVTAARAIRKGSALRPPCSIF